MPRGIRRNRVGESQYVNQNNVERPATRSRVRGTTREANANVLNTGTTRSMRRSNRTDRTNGAQSKS